MSWCCVYHWRKRNELNDRRRNSVHCWRKRNALFEPLARAQCNQQRVLVPRTLLRKDNVHHDGVLVVRTLRLKRNVLQRHSAPRFSWAHRQPTTHISPSWRVGLVAAPRNVGPAVFSGLPPAPFASFSSPRSFVTAASEAASWPKGYLQLCNLS